MVTRIMCIFPSGRMIDRSDLGLEKVAAYAEEFPTINYFFAELGA
jgi:hypothetical protein